MSVTSLGTMGEALPGIHSHTAVAWKDKVYVFGGEVVDPETGTKELSNRVYVLHTKARKWERVFTQGTPPAARVDHACVVVGNKLYVLGGRNGRVVFSAPAALNLDTCVWYAPRQSNVPPARYAHAACVVDGKIVVHGGLCGTTDKPLADAYTCDVAEGEWRAVEASGRAPPPLCHHTAVGLSGEMLVFGGVGGRTAPVDVLDVRAMAWRQQQAVNPPFDLITHHAAAGQFGVMYVFGGRCKGALSNTLHVLTPTVLAMRQWDTVRTKTPARAHHAACIAGPRLYIIGGKDEHGTVLGDVLVFNKEAARRQKERRRDERLAKEAEWTKRAEAEHEQRHREYRNTTKPPAWAFLMAGFAVCSTVLVMYAIIGI